MSAARHLEGRGRRRRRVAVFGLAAALALGSPARAGEAETQEPAEQARWSFTEGSAHYQARRYADALASLERSYALLESPNTELLIARSLRELGRGPEALARFEHAAREAARRVGLGEAKYAPTADAAKAEGDQLRARLGTVRVRVAHPEGATLTVDGAPVALDDGRAVVVHDPGTASVVVKDASGSEQRQTVTVLAGSTVEMVFSGQTSGVTKEIPSPPPPPSSTSGSRWAVPAALASGAVTVLGGGLFAGFGLSSQSIYDDLAARCGPSACGPADRDDADRGELHQTIANVSLGVAAVGAVATIAFVVVAVSSGDRAAAELFLPRAERVGSRAIPGIVSR